jgi:hypothetical protein
MSMILLNNSAIIGQSVVAAKARSRPIPTILAIRFTPAKFENA